MQVYILESVTKPSKFRENIEYAYEKKTDKRNEKLFYLKMFVDLATNFVAMSFCVC